MKIYTKTGDRGTTSLFGGKRVNKNSARIEAYGQVDELNTLIGVIISNLRQYSSSEAQRSREVTTKVSSRQARTIKEKLLRIQAELFVLGSDLSSPLSVKVKIPRISKSHITRLEKEIDGWEKQLPSLKNFILPSGYVVGAGLHLARAICRRAERAIVGLTQQEKINQNALVYINRLSDWFFVAARYANHLDKIPETIWRGRTVK